MHGTMKIKLKNAVSSNTFCIVHIHRLRYAKPNQPLLTSHFPEYEVTAPFKTSELNVMYFNIFCRLELKPKHLHGIAEQNATDIHVNMCINTKETLNSEVY